MGCVSPIRAYVGKSLKADYVRVRGYHEVKKVWRRPLAFRPGEGYTDQPRLVPCGACVGCRASQAAQWATRARLELETTSPAFFLTMTYDDDHLPGPSLVWEDLRNFWKRLRKDAPLRYLACGEYGEETNRPHYHAILFGVRLTDLVPWDARLSISPYLERKWALGRVFVAEANTATASYVAGYTAKKLRDASYPDGILPPDIRVSTKPALGWTWAEAHSHELVHDRLPVGPGRVVPVPRQILKLLEDTHPHVWRAIKALRARKAAVQEANPNRPSYIDVEKNLTQRVSPRHLR